MTPLVVRHALQQANATNSTLPATAREATQITLDKLVWAVVALLIAYFLARAVSGALTIAANEFTQFRFRLTLFIPLLKFVIYGIAVFVVIKDLFNLSQAQLVAFSGLLGAALGLGLKDFVADIVGGLVVVVEKPYQVGDKVSIGDYYGEVVDIGIRSTRLVTPNDSMIVVPNFLFFNESISNANASNPEMLMVIEFYVDPEADVERAAEIVEDALASSRYVYVSDDRPYSVVVEDDLYYRTLKGRAYVNDLRNEVPFETEVSERVLERFEAEGIESPKVPAGVDSSPE